MDETEPSMKYLVVTIRTPAFDPRVIPAHYQFLDDLRHRGMLSKQVRSLTRRVARTF